MQFVPTAIPEVIVIEPKVFSDRRGFFMEVFHTRLFAEAGIQVDFVQDNHSGSRRGTLRGLHYQIHQPQAKLLRVISGEVFDVAVDIRRNSPTFGQWVGEFLSAENRRTIYIPIGFAHGIYILSEWAEVIYKVSDFYSPEWERTLLWNDSQIKIKWPIPVEQQPILSKKDTLGLRLDEADLFD